MLAAVGSFQYPAAQMHTDAVVDPAGAIALEVSTAPHATQPSFPIQYPAGQTEVGSMHRLVAASHVVPAPQSEAATGHIVAASSPAAAATQQQRRLYEELVVTEHDGAAVLLPDR